MIRVGDNETGAGGLPSERHQAFGLCGTGAGRCIHHNEAMGAGRVVIVWRTDVVAYAFGGMFVVGLPWAARLDWGSADFLAS